MKEKAKDTTYRFSLSVGKTEVVLRLLEDGQVIDEVLIGTGFEVAEKLLPAIDALLHTHALRPEAISAFEMTSDLPEGYSARRIAETIMRVYGFALGAETRFVA